MTESPTPPPTGGNHRDAKAEAKAAKAYAKAQRPWYKKKRFIIPLAFLALVIIVSASGGGGSGGPGGGNDTSASSGANGGSDDKQATERAQSAKVGEAVELKGTRYTVESATTSDTIGPGGFGEDADGKFIVIELTIENKKNESKTFSDNAAKIIGGNGKKYSADTDAGIMADKPLIFEQMDPDNPKTGTIVFDLPPAAVAGSKLELSDLFGGGSVLVDLGLN